MGKRNGRKPPEPKENPRITEILVGDRLPGDKCEPVCVRFDNGKCVLGYYGRAFGALFGVEIGLTLAGFRNMNPGVCPWYYEEDEINNFLYLPHDVIQEECGRIDL